MIANEALLLLSLINAFASSFDSCVQLWSKFSFSDRIAYKIPETTHLYSLGRAQKIYGSAACPFRSVDEHNKLFAQLHGKYLFIPCSADAFDLRESPCFAC